MAFACALLALALGTASASAAPTWLAPQDISDPNQSITFPDVAVDAAGNAAAIWPRDIGGETIVEAAERSAGGGWSEPVVLSDPAEEEQMQAHIGLDTAGNTVAVWSTYSAVRTAVRPAGGDWSEAEDLSVQGGGMPQLAMNAAGDAVAVWVGFHAAAEVIWAASWSAGGGWSSPEVISAVSDPSWVPQVSIDAAGNAIAVWQHLGPGNTVIEAALHPPGGDWSTPETLSDAGNNAFMPRLEMNATGAAVAAWTILSGDDIQAAVHLPGGGWSAPADVSAVGEGAGEPELAIDANGSAFAIWPTSLGTDENILRAATLPPGGQWSAPEDISAVEERFMSYDLDASAVAGVVATWTRQLAPTHFGIQAAVRPPGGGWSAPDDLSDEGESAGLPTLGFDAVGNAVAIWGRKVGVDDYVLQGAGYDFAGPRLDDLRIPATGTVGKPVFFAVSPFDVFSLGTTSWAFGDGSQAAGNSISHVYNAPGRYPVTVSALDGSGNASTQTATITIAGPPPPRRQIELALRIEGESLRKLLRTGTLSVAASVNEAANVALSGRARIKAGARGAARTKLVQVFAPVTVRFAAAAEEKVTLALSKRGRKALRSLSRVKLLIAGEARDDVGGTAAQTLTHTLR